MAYSDALWQEAKNKCKLNNEDIKIAKELGLNPFRKACKVWHLCLI